MTDAIQKLVKAVNSVRRLTDTSSGGLLDRARRLPDHYVFALSCLIVQAAGYNASMSDTQKDQAKRIMALIADAERARGERERDETLAGYSIELEALRAILPALAAEAAIEIGVVARKLASEAAK